MSYYSVDDSSSVIQHFGKKGMKWGVRKMLQRPQQVQSAPQQPKNPKAVSVMKKINEIDNFRQAYGRFLPAEKKYVSKKDMSEFESLSKVFSKKRPKGGKALEKWGKAYERAAELTEKGLDEQRNRLQKQYDSYQ